MIIGRLSSMQNELCSSTCICMQDISLTDKVKTQTLKEVQKVFEDVYEDNEKGIKVRKKPLMKLAYPFKASSTSSTHHDKILDRVSWMHQGISGTMEIEATPGGCANIEASGWPVVEEESQEMHL